MARTNPVFEWQLVDGTVTGLGTRAEFDYWSAEGVLDGQQLGRVIGHELASEDDKRRAAWSKVAA